MAEQSVAPRVSVTAPGESPAIWMLGGLYEVRVSAEQSGGALTLMELTVPAGMGPPPHIHDCEETVYILEGTAKYHIDGQSFDVGPGSVVHLPKGTEEYFVPTSAMRMLAIYIPGGADRFFAEAGEPAARRELPPPPQGPPDFARLAAIAAKHGLELKAPPGH